MNDSDPASQLCRIKVIGSAELTIPLQVSQHIVWVELDQQTAFRNVDDSALFKPLGID